MRSLKVQAAKQVKIGACRKGGRLLTHFPVLPPIGISYARFSYLSLKDAFKILVVEKTEVLVPVGSDVSFNADIVDDGIIFNALVTGCDASSNNDSYPVIP